MKNPFGWKIGDKVKCINTQCTNDGLTLGSVYTVKEVYRRGRQGTWFIKTRETHGKGWFMSRFEKLEAWSGGSMIMRSKKDPGIPLRFDNHRRIVLE
jgi:hypothetical protein